MLLCLHVLKKDSPGYWDKPRSGVAKVATLTGSAGDREVVAVGGSFLLNYCLHKPPTASRNISPLPSLPSLPPPIYSSIPKPLLCPRCGVEGHGGEAVQICMS